ncbi:hypothetical protein H6800_01025, partial [Candidatus Nomurabacteria bacterium]|nr:hypothetical protein [Candidatus Nomurabacteria bacterium]
MRSIIKKFVTTFAAIALLVAPSAVLLPSAVHADIRNNVCRGVNSTGGADPDSTDCSEQDGESFSELAKKIINIFSIVVGTVSVIMIIIGG